jgi:hypothetical protein
MVLHSRAAMKRFHFGLGQVKIPRRAEYGVYVQDQSENVASQRANEEPSI